MKNPQHTDNSSWKGSSHSVLKIALLGIHCNRILCWVNSRALSIHYSMVALLCFESPILDGRTFALANKFVSPRELHRFSSDIIKWLNCGGIGATNIEWYGELIWMRLLWSNKIILFDCIYVYEKLLLRIQLCGLAGHPSQGTNSAAECTYDINDCNKEGYHPS